MRLPPIFLITTLVVILVNCSSGSGSATSKAPTTSVSSSSSSSGVASLVAPTAARGELMKSPALRTFAKSAGEFKAQLSSTSSGRALLKVAGTPECGIDVRYFQYGTVGAVGEPATASGALMIPTGNSSNCTGARPTVLYAHGTTLNSRYSLANIQDDTNEAQGEAFFIAATYAAQGYIVVAPNYIGYDGSSLSYHAYLNADQQSKEMMDALAAAKLALPAVSSNTSSNEKLFITGYSQGGHVAMATHRAMQQAGISVTASAPLSGPYALAAQSDAVFYGYVSKYAIYQGTLAIVGMQKAYGNIYSDPSDFFEMPYATDIETLFPSTALGSDLGKLARTEFFSSSPLALSVPSSTAPLTSSEASALFAFGFGNNNLIKNSAREAYLEDAIGNPDGGFPITTDSLPASAPANALRIATKKNDLRNWSPSSPVLLCGGNGDPEVYFLNTKLMGALWSDLPVGRVTLLDVDSLASSSDSTDPYYGIKVDFEQARAAIAAQPNGADAVFEAYHGDLVYSSCLIASRSFFAQF